MPSKNAILVNGHVLFDPNPKQAEIWSRLFDRVRTGTGASKFFLRGNRGGGKSVLMRAFLHMMALAFPGLKYIVVRRNMPDLRQNHLIFVGPEMRRIGGYFHETHAIAYYRDRDGEGRPIPQSMGFYRQCEDMAAVEAIVGAEGAILFVDEAPQIAWDYLTLLLPSLRVAKGDDGTQPYFVTVVFSGNPSGESIEDLDRHFLEKDITPLENPYYQPDDWEHIPIHLADNPKLDKEEYLKSLGPIPLAFRAAWIDGVRMDSRTLFRVQKTKDGKPYHYIQELPTVDGMPLQRVPWIQVYRAFDMGFFPDPAVCLWIAVLGRRVIVFHEETWFETIAKDLAAVIRKTTEELIGKPDCNMTYVDPEISIKTGVDVTVMDTLEMNGVPCEPSVNDRILYADTIHGLLGEEVQPGVPRLQIYEPGCPMLAKYLPKMRWDEKNPRKMDNHKFDHWAVCLAYFGISSGVLSLTQKSEPQAEPVWMQWVREDNEQRRRGVN